MSDLFVLRDEEIKLLFKWIPTSFIILLFLIKLNPGLEKKNAVMVTECYIMQWKGSPICLFVHEVTFRCVVYNTVYSSMVSALQRKVLPWNICLNIYPSYIFPPFCRGDLVCTWPIFVCSIPWKLQVCCTYCQRLSCKLRHTFIMRL